MSDITDCQLAYFQANGATSNDINDAAVEFLLSASVPLEDVNDMWSVYFKNNAFTGNFTDDWIPFWISVGCLPPLSIGELAVMLRTGQIISYMPGDDGDLLNGIPSVFIPLTTGQYAGTTNIVVNGKTDIINNDVVINTTVRLMTLNASSNSVGPDSNGLLLWDDPVNGEDIWGYVAAANAANLSGHNDWFIPNLNEIETIHDMSRTVIPLYDALFNFTGGNIWTSTTNGSNTSLALRKNFNGLQRESSDKLTGLYFVVLFRKF